MTATTTTARKSTSRKPAAGKAPTTRRQMEDAVIESMKEAQAAKAAAPKPAASRKVPVSKTTDASHSRAGRAAKPAPKASPKASATANVASKRELSARTWSFAGYELRSDVDDVVAKWGTKIPLVHDADGRCKSIAGLTDHKDRAWLEASWSVNAQLAATGKTRTFGFCANCVSVKSSVAAKDEAPIEVEIDLSQGERDANEIDDFESEGAKAEVDHLARVDKMAASIRNDDDDSDPEMDEILAEVAAAKSPISVAAARKNATWTGPANRSESDVANEEQAAASAPKPVRKPRAPRKPRTV